MFRRREKPSGQNQNTMLRTIATGKKPMGAKRQPKPTAMALAAYLLTVATSTRLTVRQLAAALDRDPRSCRTAVDQLITFGVDGLTWSDADALTFTPTDFAPISAEEPTSELPWNLPPVESWEEELIIDREPVDEQYSLFGGLACPTRMEATAVTAAACSVRKTKTTAIDDDSNAYISPENPPVSGADPVKTRTGGFVLDDDAANIDVDSANLAQTLCKPCTKSAQTLPKVENERLADAMARLSATFDSLPNEQNNISAHTPAPAPTPARPSKEKQELILNQSTNENQEALNHEFKLLIAHPKIVPRFDAAERERRIAEIREKVPDAAEHVVGTLANMMAFGTMPESVFYGALTDAAAPTVRNHGAFLNAKVQRLKREYRWNQTLLGDVHK